MCDYVESIYMIIPCTHCLQGQLVLKLIYFLLLVTFINLLWFCCIIYLLVFVCCKVSMNEYYVLMSYFVLIIRFKHLVEVNPEDVKSLSSLALVYIDHGDNEMG